MIQFPLREKEQRRERGSERGKERKRKGEGGRGEGKSATTMPKHNGKCDGA